MFTAVRLTNAYWPKFRAKVQIYLETNKYSRDFLHVLTHNGTFFKQKRVYTCAYEKKIVTLQAIL